MGLRVHGQIRSRVRRLDFLDLHADHFHGHGLGDCGLRRRVSGLDTFRLWGHALGLRLLLLQEANPVHRRRRPRCRRGLVGKPIHDCGVSLGHHGCSGVGRDLRCGFGRCGALGLCPAARGRRHCVQGHLLRNLLRHDLGMHGLLHRVPYDLLRRLRALVLQERLRNAPRQQPEGGLDDFVRKHLLRDHAGGGGPNVGADRQAG
mmetsp:Transcript_96097/g.188732  ORF Transcript_96097/g.188732 Transcript_96097/m.188732 type:complete len:204 (+) Transcript_96097:437-1048(+)